jgi:4-hydroxy-tetrahydrodipicolinate reductase
MINVVVTGAGGRMGGRVIACLCSNKDFRLVGAVERPKDSTLGKDAGIIAGCGECGVSITDSLDQVIGKADCLIDFTSPETTIPHLEIVAQHKKAAVIGSTGHDPKLTQSIERMGTKIPFVMAPNMSVGVSLLANLLTVASKILGADYKPSIVETHHIHKKDKPSGTALQLARSIAKGLGTTTDKIPIESIREGEVVGIHTVRLEGAGETLELTHDARSRDTFALGALRAAKWVIGKPNGIYSMHDVLGL